MLSELLGIHGKIGRVLYKHTFLTAFVGPRTAVYGPADSSPGMTSPSERCCFFVCSAKRITL